MGKIVHYECHRQIEESIWFICKSAVKEFKTKANKALVMGKINFALNVLHTTFLLPEIPLFYLGTAKAGQSSWSVNSYVGYDMGIKGWISGFVLFNEDTIPQCSLNTNGSQSPSMAQTQWNKCFTDSDH